MNSVTQMQKTHAKTNAKTNAKNMQKVQSFECEGVLARVRGASAEGVALQTGAACRLVAAFGAAGFDLSERAPEPLALALRAVPAPQAWQAWQAELLLPAFAASKDKSEQKRAEKRELHVSRF